MIRSTMRGHGEGTFQKQGKKIRYVKRIEGIRLYGPLVTGQTRAAKEEAKRLWAIKHSERTKPSNALEECLLNELAELPLELDTAKNYLSIITKHIKGTDLGRTPIGAVSPYQLEAWAQQLDVANTSKRRYLDMIRAAFNRWIRHGLVDHNPVSQMQKPKRDQVSKSILRLNDADDFLSLIPERFRMTTALNCHGLRTGEALGVYREDFDGRGISVQRQVSKDGTIKNYTKTKQMRWVPIAPPLRAPLAAMQPGLIVRTENGGPVSPGNYRRAIRKALAGSRFEGFKPTWLRSSFATWLRHNPREQADMTGHSEQVALRYYIRTDQDDLEQAMLTAFGFDS